MRKNLEMADPIDGLPFWVTHDQFMREKARADAAEAEAALLRSALEVVAKADGVWEERDDLESYSPAWLLAFEWYDRVLALKRVARNSLDLAKAGSTC